MIRESIERKSLPLAMAALAVAALLLTAPPLVAQPQGPGGAGGPGPGFGQGPGHHGAGLGFLGGRGFERLARFLELTEEQRAQARAIHQATREQAQPIFEESRALRTGLHDLLAEEAPNPTTVGEKVIAIHANRDALRQLHESARAQFEALLTPEQLERLAEFKERRHERRGRRGGPGPGGGLF